MRFCPLMAHIFRAQVADKGVNLVQEVVKRIYGELLKRILTRWQSIHRRSAPFPAEQKSKRCVICMQMARKTAVS